MSEFSILAQHFESWKDLFKRSDSWFISRKLNGRGVIWDGGITKGRDPSKYPWYSGFNFSGAPSTGLWSIRDGKVLHAPKEWTDHLPKLIPLQGELWLEDNLQEVLSITKTDIPDPIKWDKVKFMVYNVKPYCTFEGMQQKEWMNKYWENTPFSERFLDIPFILRNNPVCQVPEMRRIYNDDFGKSSFKGWLAKDKEENWEGLMFQDINGLYENKRSYTILKKKPKYDYTVTITGYRAAKEGKHHGKIGAISAEITWDDQVISMHGGKEEFIGRTIDCSVGGLRDDERLWEDVEENFPVGDTLEVTFCNISQYGVPQSCNMMRF